MRGTQPSATAHLRTRRDGPGRPTHARELPSRKRIAPKKMSTAPTAIDPYRAHPITPHRKQKAIPDDVTRAPAILLLLIAFFVEGNSVTSFRSIS